MEMHKKSRVSRRAVPAKYMTEADTLTLPTQLVSLQNVHVCLNQLQETFLSSLKCKKQARFNKKKSRRGHHQW